MKPFYQSVRDFERDYWLTLMDACGWNYAQAARESGINRTHLYTLLKRASITRPVRSKHGRTAAGPRA